MEGSIRVSKSDFAKACRVSRPTIYVWLRQGLIQVEGDGKISIDELEAVTSFRNSRKSSILDLDFSVMGDGE